MDFIRSSLITNALISAYSPYYADTGNTLEVVKEINIRDPSMSVMRQ
jgi:hypothetical protein